MLVTTATVGVRGRRQTLAMADPCESARAAGLRYVSADMPGIRRRRAGKGWCFLRPDNTLLRDKKEIRRILSLAIPPAWTNVWICPLPNGHLQALGLDVRGRKQYRYHPLFREIRDISKFTRMLEFGAALPTIRRRIEEDLKLPGLPRRKVLATLTRLLEHTSIRVGNEEYAKANDSFGLTTLRDHHAEISGGAVRFSFKGKSGIAHEVEVTDRRVARIVAASQDLPGEELFQYVDESGEPAKICSEDVNAYIREISGEDFTAKDFRTWNGTREALALLHATAPGESLTEIKRQVVAAVKSVAGVLRNRPATCRKYYIHPAVLEGFSANALADCIACAEAQQGPHGLSREEVAVLRLVERYVLKPSLAKQRAA